MRTIKNFTTLCAITGLLLMSCGNDAKTSDKTTTETSNNLELDEKVETLYNGTEDNEEKPESMAMNDGTTFSHDAKKEDNLSLENWTSYNKLSTEVVKFQDPNYKIDFSKLSDLGQTIENLGSTVPKFLKTEEVMEDVADIQKEYKELMAEHNAPDKEKRENLEELSEQFDDFNEELNETIDKYVKINEKALKEYNKKLKKGDVKAAQKEYDEQIKKQHKIADYEEEAKQ